MMLTVASLAVNITKTAAQPRKHKMLQKAQNKAPQTRPGEYVCLHVVQQ